MDMHLAVYDRRMTDAARLEHLSEQLDRIIDERSSRVG
jgi:hypothetical protein